MEVFPPCSKNEPGMIIIPFATPLSLVHLYYKLLMNRDSSPCVYATSIVLCLPFQTAPPIYIQPSNRKFKNLSAHANDY